MPSGHIRRVKSVEVLLPEEHSEEDLVDFSMVFESPRRRHSFSRWLSTDSGITPPHTGGDESYARVSTPVPIPRPSHRSNTTPEGTPVTPVIISVGSGGRPVKEHIGIVTVQPLEASVDQSGTLGLSQEDSSGSLSSAVHLLAAEELHLSQMSEHNDGLLSVSASPEPSPPRFFRPRGWSAGRERSRHSRTNSTPSLGAFPFPVLPMVRTKSSDTCRGGKATGAQSCERSNTGSSDGEYLELGFDSPVPKETAESTVDEGRGRSFWQAVSDPVVSAAPLLTHVAIVTSVAAMVWFGVLRK